MPEILNLFGSLYPIWSSTIIYRDITLTASVQQSRDSYYGTVQMDMSSYGFKSITNYTILSGPSGTAFVNNSHVATKGIVINGTVIRLLAQGTADNQYLTATIRVYGEKQ